MNRQNNIILENGISIDFKFLFEAYFRTLVLFANRYLDCREECESIVQDTFILLWESKGKFNGELSIKSFLYTTVYHKSLDVLKHRKVKETFALRMENEDETETSYMKHLIEEETRRLIFSAIDSLPEQCRKVCLLNLEGKENAEIAEILQISLNTVKFHKKNAYKILRKKLQSYLYFLFLAF